MAKGRKKSIPYALRVKTAGSKERKFTCGLKMDDDEICQKSYTRKDVLQKHQNVDHAPPEE
jgi:hypothetical protein